jgi:hypothetical protein
MTSEARNPLASPGGTGGRGEGESQCFSIDARSFICAARAFVRVRMNGCPVYIGVYRAFPSFRSRFVATNPLQGNFHGEFAIPELLAYGIPEI